MVTARDGDVLRARTFDGAHPFFGIKAVRIKRIGCFGILLRIHAGNVHKPFAIAIHRVDSPMDKNAELHIRKFLTAFPVFLRGHILILRHSAQSYQRANQNKRQSFHIV